MTSPSGSTSGSAPAAPDVAWYALTPDEVAKRQNVDPAVGLTSADVEARRSTYGKNTFDQAKKAYEKALELDPKNLMIRQNYDLFKEINDRTKRRSGK